MTISLRALRPLLLFALLSCCLSRSLFTQTVLLRESFDDGELSHNPLWQKFHAQDLITVDSTRRHSPSFSCRIATTSQRSAMETSTRLFSSTQSFQINFLAYVETMGDEAIPLLLRGSSTVLAMFLLPSGLVQLDVLKSTSVWETEQLRVPGGYTLDRWMSFRVIHDGGGRTSLYIDNVFRGEVNQQLVTVPTIMQIGNMYLPHTSTFFVDDITVVTAETLPPPGKVRLVLCSDTGTWDGLDVSRRNVYLGFDLYSNSTGNASLVINHEFRNRICGSDRQPLVFTWFMLDGSMVATNTNPIVQHRWISNLEMMKRHHGDTLAALGDELSFHYHNWVWNDPDRNGVFHWNQSNDLRTYREDFLKTLGHFIIEGRMLPTSFRSGWHFMDNQWENLIDSLIPYRFENTAPGRGADITEPLDNIYDWSRASREWVPYHPDDEDYQREGNLRGWETRCTYMKSVSLGTMLEAFSQAFRGKDQIMTLWSHLPESDFPQQILRVDSIAHQAHEFFPEVEFSYVTASEAMKQWRGIRDNTPPALQWSAHREADSMRIMISSDEPLWQSSPLCYVKDVSSGVQMLAPRAEGIGNWSIFTPLQTIESDTLGIAAADTAGNATVLVFPLQLVNVIKTTTTLPKEFSLHQNYPNPFNPATSIGFQIPKSAFVTLTILNTLGQEVATLVSEQKAAGAYSVRWNCGDKASGVYFYRLVARDFVQTKKMLFLR